MKSTRVAAFLVATLAVGLSGATAANGAASKVQVCHSDDEGVFRVISISDRAYENHVAHGDAVPGGDVPGMPNHVFDDSCVPVLVESNLAVAYVDVVDDGGGYDSEIDVLVARLADTNATGVPDAGDTVFTDRYPLNVAGSALGSFGVTEHEVAEAIVSPERCTVVSPAGSTFGWAQLADWEIYEEGDATIIPDFPVTGMSIADWLLDGGVTDVVAISRPEWVASEPEGPVTSAGFQPGDSAFIDVELDCGAG